MNWKNMPLSHKIALIISFLAVVAWLIPIVQPDLLPFDPSYPAIAVFTACEAVFCWKKQRGWAYLLIVAAVICAACYIWGLML